MFVNLITVNLQKQKEAEKENARVDTKLEKKHTVNSIVIKNTGKNQPNSYSILISSLTFLV